MLITIAKNNSSIIRINRLSNNNKRLQKRAKGKFISEDYTNGMISGKENKLFQKGMQQLKELR